MPYNDYFRITYYILSTVLKAMEEGRDISPDEISAEKLMIPQRYWNSIVRNCVKDGLLDDVNIRHWSHGAEDADIDVRHACLTIKGVQFLQDNEKMNEVKDYLKSVK